MRYLKILFDLYLKSSTHVSLAVVAFSGITILHFGIKPNPDLLTFIFFGTITGYNFVKYAAIAKFHHFSLSKSLRMIQIYSFLCFAGLIWAALKLPLPVLLTAAVLGGFNLLYALPFFSDQYKLRSITGAKIFVIALVWTGVTVWLPALDAQLPFSVEIGIASLQRFLLVMVLILPFDIRDIRFDTEQLGTVPQLVGVEKTRSIGLVLLGIVVLLELFQPSASGPEIAVMAAMAIFTAWLVQKSVIRQNRYYASFWVEGVPVLWWAILVIVTG
ncbi:MAG: hypothetical protein WD038_09780 [Balneolales bacterium]